MCIKLALYSLYGVLCLLLIALAFSPIAFYRIAYSAAGGAGGYIRVKRSETFRVGDYFCDKLFLRRLEDDNVTTALTTMGEKEILDALELPDGTKIEEELRDVGRCRFLLQELEYELLGRYGVDRDSCRCRYEISMILAFIAIIVSVLATVYTMVELIVYFGEKIEPLSVYLHTFYTTIACLLWLTCTVFLVMRIIRSDNEIYVPQRRQTASHYYETPGKLLALPFLTSLAFLTDLILLILWAIQSFEIYYDRKLDEYLFERRYAGIKRHGNVSPINSSRSWSENQSRTRNDRCGDNFSFETGEIRRCDRHDYHRFVTSWPNSHQI